MPAIVRNQKKNKIQNFVASLYYLNQEAQREDLTQIADILKESICRIDHWMAKEPIPNVCNGNFLDASLYYAVDFLHKFAGLPQDKQHTIARLIETQVECNQN